MICQLGVCLADQTDANDAAAGSASTVGNQEGESSLTSDKSE